MITEDEFIAKIEQDILPILINKEPLRKKMLRKKYLLMVLFIGLTLFYYAQELEDIRDISFLLMMIPPLLLFAIFPLTNRVKAIFFLIISVCFLFYFIQIEGKSYLLAIFFLVIFLAVTLFLMTMASNLSAMFNAISESISTSTGSYKKEVKLEVMGKVLTMLGDLSIQKQTMELRILNDSLLFDFDNYHNDDHISGTYHGKKFNIQECTLSKDSGETEKTIFHGIIISTKLDKSFLGHTNVMKDTLLSPFYSPEGLEKTLLESVVFEKIFNVYTNDQIEARYILTPTFMEKLVELGELNESDQIRAAFFNNQVLIAIETKHNFFEPVTLLEEVENPSRFRVIYKEIKTIYTILDIIHTA